MAPSEAREVGLRPAVAGEARVERAVQVVARHQEVVVGLSHRDDLAVSLAHDRLCCAGPGAEVGSRLAVSGEGRVGVARGGDGRCREDETGHHSDDDHPQRPWSELRDKPLTHGEPHSDRVRRRPGASASPLGLVGGSGDRRKANPLTPTRAGQGLPVKCLDGPGYTAVHGRRLMIDGRQIVRARAMRLLSPAQTWIAKPILVASPLGNSGRVRRTSRPRCHPPASGASCAWRCWRHPARCFGLRFRHRRPRA